MRARAQGALALGVTMLAAGCGVLAGGQTGTGGAGGHTIGMTSGSTSSGGGTTTGGGGGTSTTGQACELWSLHPPIASLGTSVSLEGHFPSGAEVTFPGSQAMPLTIAGASQDRVTVGMPADAATGDLVVSCPDGSSAKAPFRRATYELGLGTSFRQDYEQATVARQRMALSVPITGQAAVAIGPWVYVIGGVTGLTTISSDVQRARVNADGSLGAFVPAGISLAMGVNLATWQIVGSYLYVLGGGSATTHATTPAVQRASIDPATGDLGPFTIVGNLLTARGGAGSAVIGSYLYVFSGSYSTASGVGGIVTSAERAPIAADGSLGAFENVDLGLPTNYLLQAPAVIGDQLYFFGCGVGTGSSFTEVRQAAIGADGSLGPLTDAGIQLPLSPIGDAVVLGRTVYLLGGFTPSGYSPSIVSTFPDASGKLVAPQTLAGATLAQYHYPTTSVVAGDQVYVLGGRDHSNYAMPWIERASINAGGQLGSFAEETGAALAFARRGHSAVALGDAVYVFGGTDEAGTSYPQQVERAPVGPDGRLGAFAPVAGLSIGSSSGAGRAFHATVVTRRSVCLIGGDSPSGVLATVECADIDPATGKIGAFAQQATQLTKPRGSPTAFMIGDTLHVAGGDATGLGAPESSVESATVDWFGNIGAFGASSLTLATPRIGAAPLVLAGSVFVLGGTDGVSALSSAEQAPTTGGVLGSFAAASQHPGASGFGGLVAGPGYYLIGGGAQVEHAGFGPADSLSSIGPGSASTPLLGFGAVVGLGNRAYLLGGDDGVSSRTAVYGAPLQ